jgi:hypothetical protein
VAGSSDQLGQRLRAEGAEEVQKGSQAGVGDVAGGQQLVQGQAELGLVVDSHGSRGRSHGHVAGDNVAQKLVEAGDVAASVLKGAVDTALLVIEGCVLGSLGTAGSSVGQCLWRRTGWDVNGSGDSRSWKDGGVVASWN